MSVEAYASEAVSLLVGIGTGIVVGAKLWWTSKTKDEKLDLISDAMTSLEDGKITTDEAVALIKEHL